MLLSLSTLAIGAVYTVVGDAVARGEVARVPGGGVVELDTQFLTERLQRSVDEVSDDLATS